jgi:hypothetical protein
MRSTWSGNGRTVAWDLRVDMNAYTPLWIAIVGIAALVLWWVRRDESRASPHKVKPPSYPRPLASAPDTLRFHASKLLTDAERDLLEKLSNAYPDLSFWVDVAAFRLLRPGFRRKKNDNETERYDGMNALLAHYAVDIVAFNDQYEPKFVGLVSPPDLGTLMPIPTHFTERLEHLCVWLQSAGIPYVFIRESEPIGALVRRIHFATAHPTVEATTITNAREDFKPTPIHVVASRSTRPHVRVKGAALTKRAPAKSVAAASPIAAPIATHPTAEMSPP